MAKVFSREATGLTREFGFLDAFLLNMAVVNVAGGLAYDILQLFFFPGASLPLVFLLGGIPAFGIFLVYTSLSIIFPRTGGDYVYISRIVHPTAGMANAWLNILGFFLFTLTGFNAWYVVYTGLPSLLTSLAVSTGDMGYARIASFIQTNITFDFALSTIVLIIGACIVMFGLKVFKWAFRLIFVYYFLSAALLAALLLVTNHTMFINAIGKDTYSNVISSASQMGVYRFSLTETLLAAVPLGFLTFTGFQSSVYIGSEVKNVKRNQTLALGVSMLLTWVYLVVLAYAASNIFSNSFLQAASYLWATNPSAMPFSATPFITFLLSIIYRNPAIAFLLNSVPVVGGFLLIPSTILASSRILFALSFDRILPEWVSHVNERLRSPVYSVILMMVIAEIWVVVLYFFGYISTWLSLSLATPPGLVDHRYCSHSASFLKTKIKHAGSAKMAPCQATRSSCNGLGRRDPTRGYDCLARIYVFANHKLPIPWPSDLLSNRGECGNHRSFIGALLRCSPLQKKAGLRPVPGLP
ncbi:hypothetical protein B9Q00_11190 [Candidatus Marsarchaeota G1 archaeon OSP_C]|jgi:Amino acid transporters|uniref:Amino acid permease/ SLC12A domain-containing protein n=1 Tax=Candidatus Marsarchaeota G1 archaeon OSP_C TaxID=1978154 RepID=A0A2R6AFK0_9ARCH|nr:MAG: hypothetical protein B9Q00_11190 [Candidatus Marsarchaeota G1 archaeon OSP_C]